MSISTILEALNVILAFTATGLLIYMIKKSSEIYLGVTLIYFLAGTIFLLAIPLFMLFFDLNQFSVSAATFEIWWHGLFYFSMAIFWFAAQALIQFLATRQSSPVFMGPAVFSAAAVFMLVFTSFFIVTSLNPFLTVIFGGWLWSTLGLQHLIALIITVIAGIYMLKIQGGVTYKKIVVMSPFLIVFVLFAGVHLLELLVENWHLLAISEQSKKVAEQGLLCSAFFLLLYAFWKIKNIILETGSQTTP